MELLTCRISPLRKANGADYQCEMVDALIFNFQFLIISCQGGAKGAGRIPADSAKHYFARTKYKIFFT